MLRRWLACGLLVLATGCGELSDVVWSLLPGIGMSLETPAEQRAALVRAHEAFERHDYRTAYSLFRGMVRAYPALADHHLFLAGKSALQLDRSRDAARFFEALLRDFPRSVHAPAAAVEAGRLALRRDRLHAARAHLYRALNEATDEATRRAAQLTVAEAEEKAGDAPAANRHWIAVRSADPTSAEGKAAKQRLLELRSAHPELAPVGGDLLTEARLLLAEGDSARAADAAAALLAAPSGVDPAEVTRVLADAQYAAGKLDPSMKAYWAISERYPTSPQAPLALLRMATLLWNRDRDRAALRIFEQFLSGYPRHEKAPEALYAVARLHEKAGRDREAIARLTELALHHRDSSLAPEARWRIGWIHFHNRRYREAVTAFASAGGAGAAASYWQGRALEAAREIRGARRLYTQLSKREPTSYYGVQARRRLDGLGSAALRLHSIAPAEAAGVELEPPPFVDDFHLPRWLELHAAGVAELARLELAAIEREHGGDPAVRRYLVDAYRSVDGHSQAIRLVRGGAAPELSAEDRIRLTHPLAFWAPLRRAADSQAVDPLLVVAIMRQESLFDPQARSTADARGLLQLLPSTAEQVAPGLDPSADPGNLYDPETNLRLGTRYLRTLLDRFQGDVLKTAAAYNGGEAAADRWIAQTAGDDPDVFVEAITYRETRDYVKRIIGNYAEYERLYGHNRTASSP